MSQPDPLINAVTNPYRPGGSNQPSLGNWNESLEMPGIQGYENAKPPTAPTEESPEIKAAAEEEARKEKEKLKKAKGRRSTILTNPWGIEGAPQTQSASLLGKEKLGE